MEEAVEEEESQEAHELEEDHVTTSSSASGADLSSQVLQTSYATERQRRAHPSNPGYESPSHAHKGGHEFALERRGHGGAGLLASPSWGRGADGEGGGRDVRVMGGNITSGNIISANASTVDPCPGINLHAYIHTSCRGHLHLPLDSRLAPSLRETTPAQHID